MAERQLPKLNTRVRFPSPAPRRSKRHIACSDLFYKSERAHSAAPPFQIEPAALGFDLVLGTDLKVVASILFWLSKIKAPAKAGAFTLGAIGSLQCSAEVNSAYAKVFASGKNPCTAQTRRPAMRGPVPNQNPYVSMMQKAAGGLVLRGLRWLFLFFTSGGGPGRPGSPGGCGGGEAG